MLAFTWIALRFIHFTSLMLEKTLWLAGETETLADLYIKCGGLHHDVPVLSEAEMTIVLEKFKTYGLKA